MNGVREEYSIKVKQTSKGIWYCDGLQVITEHVVELASTLDQLMDHIEAVLTKHNEPEPVDVTPESIKKKQKDVKDKWEKVAKKPGDK